MPERSGDGGRRGEEEGNGASETASCSRALEIGDRGERGEG